MGVSLWMYVTFIWISMTLLGGFMDMAYSTTEENQSAMNTIIQLKVFKFWEFELFGNQIAVPWPNLSFFQSMVTLMLRDYEFFKGDLNIIRWLFLTVTAGMSFILVTRIMPVILEVIATLRRLSPI